MMAKTVAETLPKTSEAEKLAAFNKVLDALKGLDKDARQAVIHTVTIFYNIYIPNN